jgi:hypothetical protein
VTYCDVNESSTPSNEVLVLGDVCIRQQLHEVEECGLGFTKESSHDSEE